MALHRIELDDLISLRRHAQRERTGSRAGATPVVGLHAARHRGRGLDFEEHRLYQPGDEARSIDWRVTARTGKPHVRVYREEREQRVLLAVDLRAAMRFGTRGCFKHVLAARAAALLAWRAAQGGDRVGGIAFGRGAARVVRPAGGTRGVMHLLHALSLDDPGSLDAPESLAAAIAQLLHMARPGARVALLSDFRGLAPADADTIQHLSRSAELLLCFVFDPLEAELPPPGVYPLAHNGDVIPLQTHAAARRQWRAAFEARREAVRKLARESGAQFIELCTARPVTQPLSMPSRRRIAA